MVGCCEDALAVFESRRSIDRFPQLVRVAIHGLAYHVYYRSEEYIYNLFNSTIPPFVGHPSSAPQEFYGSGTYEADPELMELVSIR